MKFKLLNHDVNRGLSASRNTGMKNATGEFVFFVDSDDYLYPDSLKILMNYHLQEPGADLIMGNHYDELYATRHHKIADAKTVRYMNMLFIGKTRKISAWNSLVSRKLLVDNKIEFVDGIYFEDNVFNYQLIPLVRCAVVAPEITYFYRKNPKGIIHKAAKEKIEKVVNDYLLILTFFLEHLDSNCYVGKSIAILDKSMLLADIVRYNASGLNDFHRIYKQVAKLRKQFLLSHVFHIRIFLLLLSIILIPPFNGLARFGWFRHHYDKIVLAFGRCAICWDKVLSLIKSNKSKQ